MRAGAKILFALGFTLTGMTADSQLTDAEKTDGWKLLFNGTSTTDRPYDERQLFRKSPHD